MLGVVFLVVAAAEAGAAGPKVWSLKLNDGFTLANSRIACLVQNRPDHGYRFNTLVCFKQTRRLTYRPAPNSYVLVVDEIGVGVERLDRHGRPSPVFAKSQPKPTGAPRVAHSAEPVLGGVAQVHLGDAVYLAGTHIVCVDSGATPTLGCGSQGSRGLTVKSYLAALTDAGVEVDRVDGPGHFTPVFQATG